MPDNFNLDDVHDFGFGPGSDFGHDHYDNDSEYTHEHGFYGHGGFINANHFEWADRPQRGGSGDIKGLAKFLLGFAFIGGITVIGLITFFVIFLS